MSSPNQRTDLGLIRRIREGDTRAREELVQKYLPMVKHIVRRYYSLSLDFEDLVQEGTIGLLNSINEYRPDRYDVKFSSFAYLCIVRKLYNVIKQSNGNKHKALNEAISLQSYINADETRTVLDKVVVDEDKIDPLEVVEQKAVAEELAEVLKNHLSTLEYVVIVLLIEGYSTGEIVDEIGVGPKVVDNARTCVKTKLRRILKKYGSLVSPNVPPKVRHRRDLYIRFGG